MSKPGPHALVSGASSGIGLAITQLLLAQGYRVTGISRRGQVSGLEDENFLPQSLDLGDLELVERRIGELLQTSQFDCFIHAAGRGDFGSIEQFSRAQIEQSMRVNLLSGMLICRGLVPSMRRLGRGRIIFIGSESALQAGRKGALYSAAKFGLRGFSQALREDCAADGIQVSLVNPGMVRSPFFDSQAFAPGAKPENAIEVDDVAALVLQILQSSNDIVIDEINLSARVKSIDFKRKS
jgi:3-hydroxy acid dehydrogenase / malonic semialdehyde reductase